MRVRGASFLTVSLLAFFLTLPAISLAAAPADIAVRFTNGPFTNGRTSAYTISLLNLGPAATDEPVVVQIDLPPGAEFASGGGADVNCQASGAQVLCTRETPLRSRGIVTFRVRVDFCSPLSRVATVLRTIYPNDPKPANNERTRVASVRRGICGPTRTPTLTPTITPTLPPGPAGTPTATPPPTATRTPIPASANLAIVTTRLDVFRVGSRASYLVSVSNLGPAATNVPITVRHELPSGLTFGLASGTGWDCATAGSLVTCERSATISSTASSSYTLAVDVGAAAYPSVTTVSEVSYPADPDLSNNTDRRPTTVRR